MIKNNTFDFAKHFKNIELTENYEPYFCSIGDVITIIIIGTFCNFRNLKQIQEWASHEKISEILWDKFALRKVPSYSWLLKLLASIDPVSMNECFANFIASLLPEKIDNLTVSFDGKTIRSTANMACYENPLHIVSAQVAELGLTIGQEAVEGKSNEIPATQRLIRMLNLKGSVVVADALNCQKATATAIIARGADYLLSVKDNQPTLKKDIETFIQDDNLRLQMETSTTEETNRGRVEVRTAYVTDQICCLSSGEQWENLIGFGAINTQFTTKTGISNEWHYYITSKTLTADELLKHARAEWSVETMHYILDVHFGEDFCRVQDENVQRTLNAVRKIVINCLRIFREKNCPKRPFTSIMLGCLIDLEFIKSICNSM